MCSYEDIGISFWAQEMPVPVQETDDEARMVVRIQLQSVLNLNARAPNPKALLVFRAWILQALNSEPQAINLWQAANCPACGNVYAEDSIFCRKCGHKRGEVRA